MLNDILLLVLVLLAYASAAPPDLCSYAQNTACTGHKLAAAAQNSASGCCSLCKDTDSCTAWTWNSESRQCDALADCHSAVASFATVSGSVRKLPASEWPSGKRLTLGAAVAFPAVTFPAVAFPAVLIGTAVSPTAVATSTAAVITTPPLRPLLLLLLRPLP